MGLCATDLSAHRPFPHARTHRPLCGLHQGTTGPPCQAGPGPLGPRQAGPGPHRMPLGPCQAGPGPHMGPWAHAWSGPSQGRAGFRSTLGPVNVFLLFFDLFQPQKRPKIPETCHFSKTFLNFRRNRQPEFPAMGRRPMGAPWGPPWASWGPPWGPMGAPMGLHGGPHGAPMGAPMESPWGPLWGPHGPHVRKLPWVK